MSVYEYKLNKNIIYKKVNSKYAFPFSDDVKQLIIDMWAGYKKGYYYNSDNVRLDSIRESNDADILGLSKTDFYSLLISNIIKGNVDDFAGYVYDNYEDKEHIAAMEELTSYYLSLPECNSFSDLIANGRLSNALAISVQVVDDFGNLLLVKRTSNVGIGQRLYSVTATGAVDDDDWNEDDPIKHCACRELKEELNLDINLDQVKLVSIVAGVNKKQPIAVLTAIIDCDLKEEIKRTQKEKIFNFEVDKAFICKRDEIKSILKSFKFSEAAEYHLSLYAL